MRTLISDKGSQMTSKLLASTLKILGIQHNLASVQHHQSNGNAERTIRTLNEMMSMYMNNEQSNWAAVLPFVTLAFNCSPSKSTKISPFLAVYGREPQMPSTLSIPEKWPKAHQEFLHSLAIIREQIRENILKAQRAQALEYNKHRRRTSFAKDDLVMVYKYTRKIGKNPKLQQHFYGPFRIVEVVDDLNYRVTPLLGDKANVKFETIHIENLKPYISAEEEDSEQSTEDKEIVVSKNPKDSSDVNPKEPQHGYNLRPRRQ
jgi:hypothetical protein